MDNQAGFLRLPQVLEILPMSKSSWWAGVKIGKYPASCKISSRITCWRKSDIYNLVEKLSGESVNKKMMQGISDEAETKK